MCLGSFISYQMQRNCASYRYRDKAIRRKVNAKQKVVQNYLIQRVTFRMLPEKVFTFKFEEPWGWFEACYWAFVCYSRKLNTGWFKNVFMKQNECNSFGITHADCSSLVQHSDPPGLFQCIWNLQISQILKILIEY